MAVFRIEKTRDYTVMSNHHLRDMSLSLKAKGLLSLMLSLPENWDYTMKGLSRICKDGIDSISGGIRELEEHGYLIRERVRGANGQLGSIEYTILEQPNIAYISQDNYLFDETVLENIRMGKPSATDEEVYQAARDCGCYDFILNLENGFHTVVGGAGGHLSGGERQRIAIARAVLKNAPIVILDEATAYIDAENEALIQEAMAKVIAGKTVLMIAHRLSTITDADKIVVIKDGQIIDEGTHENLLTSCTLYQEMWKAHMDTKDVA